METHTNTQGREKGLFRATLDNFIQMCITYVIPNIIIMLRIKEKIEITNKECMEIASIPIIYLFDPTSTWTRAVGPLAIKHKVIFTQK